MADMRDFLIECITMLWFCVGVTEGLGGVSVLCAGPRLVFLLSPENHPAVWPALPPAHGRGCLPGSNPHTHPNPPDTHTFRLQGPSHATPLQGRRRVQQFAQGGDATSTSSSPSSSPPTSYRASPSARSGCRASCSGAATSTQTALVCPGYLSLNWSQWKPPGFTSWLQANEVAVKTWKCIHIHAYLHTYTRTHKHIHTLLVSVAPTKTNNGETSRQGCREGIKTIEKIYGCPHCCPKY